MKSQAYFSFPTISREKIAFVYNNKIFLTSVNGGKAEPLTIQLGIISHLQFSPSGKFIAFNLEIDNIKQIFLIDIENKKFKQLTYFSIDSIVKGWKDDEVIIFTSSFNKPFFFYQDFYILYLLKLSFLMRFHLDMESLLNGIMI